MTSANSPRLLVTFRRRPAVRAAPTGRPTSAHAPAAYSDSGVPLRGEQTDEVVGVGGRARDGGPGRGRLLLGSMYVLELAFGDDERRLAARPAHRQRLDQLHAEGRLLLAGSWDDDSGALLVFRTDRAGMDEIMAPTRTTRRPA